MWQSLDSALGCVFSDPVWAWGAAWSIVRDCADRFPDVARAAAGLMGAIFGPLPSEWDLP